MSVSLEEARKIAELANLNFTDEELCTYCGHLNKILTYVEKLQELDTEEVEPTYSVQSSRDTMRDDRTESSLSQDEALKNAPAQGQGFFRVPKVIQNEGRQI
ncbi:Asp-tRNA(Asn)/Glu-tRNA(Gln) amidotransferase subunit GatC [bacterium]|nr:Asp-tRNA(Asn)/Glu-tRNA(Gln) amidotransferase subunit GatC [bacterium]